MLNQLTKPIKSLKILCGTLLVGFSTQAVALNSDVEKPVSIEANSVVFNKNAGTAVYSGRVEIVQGTLRIIADRIEINAPGNEIQTMKATGKPVQFKQTMDSGKQAVGQANLIQYYVTKKLLQLSGNASLKQDKDAFTSNHIEYSTASGELKAGSNKNQQAGKPPGRVKAIFYPTNKAQ
uniref:Lipopolysaccharide export system protein LptA n=1 Tax=uncultured Thiotrichaceae bacterium TaxID=298394 RepID=A0A6S6S9V4_9GAMM|nr:MAG: Lipopolysaccharide export system protein LptA [uncultured Thiotrichaceae bacterium]